MHVEGRSNPSISIPCAYPCEVLIEWKLDGCIGQLQVTRYKLPIALQYCPIGQNKFYCCGNLPSFATITAVLAARAAVNPWNEYVPLHFQHLGAQSRERACKSKFLPSRVQNLFLLQHQGPVLPVASNQLVFWAPTDYYSGPSRVLVLHLCNLCWSFGTFVNYGLVLLKVQ